MSWRWLSIDVVLAIHDRQLSEHGGLDGVRDLGAIEAALARSQNLMTYTAPDVAALAAAYAFGLARNQGFLDGNKRTSWVAARLFLADNGFRLKFDPLEAVQIVEALAAGTLEESKLADWLRQRLT